MGVGRALKSRKLTPCFVALYRILEKVDEVAYRIALPPSLANLHDVFHVSQLRRYIPDPSRVVQVDDIEDLEVKQFRGKEIALMKVVWGGPSGESMTWEREDQLKESYPVLFPSAWIYEVFNCMKFCRFMR
ncbi:uncharacterized protein LOC131647812 [Vicia villosa]|uniref:uncharacterized protein LOC131647812 n=1 Tax=Vicia villosa TaxID=3911 RepID=UPI00273C395E|nr:uncharacterized protein LOC131647812 [Vicia villosa]